MFLHMAIKCVYLFIVFIILQIFSHKAFLLRRSSGKPPVCRVCHMHARVSFVNFYGAIAGQNLYATHQIRFTLGMQTESRDEKDSLLPGRSHM